MQIIEPIVITDSMLGTISGEVSEDEYTEWDPFGTYILGVIELHEYQLLYY